MKILIADSSAIINSRLTALVSESNSKVVIYQAKSYKESITVFNENKPAVVVLDSGLEGSRSVHLLKEIKAVNETTVVIILSMQVNGFTRQKYQAADFFLDKYHDFQKIPVIIKNILLKNNQ